MHQTYDKKGVERDDCTANIIHPPIHSYQENTLPSIQAAIDLGADIVEIDIHPTIDGEIIVFHDWTLPCRTDGSGVTQDQTSDYLKSLDIGYGYTADNGKTYPFRGQFVGAMPTLGEVLTAFPETSLFVNIQAKACLKQYLLYRFERRLKKVGSKAMLMGSYTVGEQAHPGIDDNESIPEKFGGIAWTNRIDVLGSEN